MSLEHRGDMVRCILLDGSPWLECEEETVGARKDNASIPSARFTRSPEASVSLLHIPPT